MVNTTLCENYDKILPFQKTVNSLESFLIKKVKEVASHIFPSFILILGISIKKFLMVDETSTNYTKF